MIGDSAASPKPTRYTPRPTLGRSAARSADVITRAHSRWATTTGLEGLGAYLEPRTITVPSGTVLSGPA